MVGDGRDPAVDTKQLIHGHLRRAHRILDREDNIIRNFDELADEREILRTARHQQRPVAAHARHEFPSRIMKAAAARDPIPPPTRKDFEFVFMSSGFSEEFGCMPKKSAAAATLAMMIRRIAGGIHDIAGAFHGRYQLIGRGQQLVVTHCSRAVLKRHYDFMDAGNSFQRVRYLAGAAVARHTRYFRRFSLQGDASFCSVE